MNKIVLPKKPKQLKENYVLIKLGKNPGEQKTASGIIMAPTSKSPFIKGVVTDGFKLDLFDVGDEIYIREDTGTKISVDGVDYVYTMERDILFSV